MNAENNMVIARLLAEVLRLQRCAGGDTISAVRIFGLMHGFESAMASEQGSGVSRATQTKVEDLLNDVDTEKLPCNGLDSGGNILLMPYVILEAIDPDPELEEPALSRSTSRSRPRKK